MYRKLKTNIFNILEARSDSNVTRWVTIFILTLISLNVIAVILETVESLSIKYSNVFYGFEVVSISIFTIEYFLRIWSCNTNKQYKGFIIGRIKYALTPMVIIDLFAILPFYLPLKHLDLRFLRAIRLIRFIRLLKVTRYFSALGVIKNVLQSKKEELILSISMVIILLILASSSMYFAEHQAQPDKFSSIPESMWWGITTLTTVGYGDIYPITTLGKILGGVISLLGIAMFALPTGILSSGFTEEMRRRNNNKNFCPQCGSKTEPIPD